MILLEEKKMKKAEETRTFGDQHTMVAGFLHHNVVGHIPRPWFRRPREANLEVDDRLFETLDQCQTVQGPVLDLAAPGPDLDRTQIVGPGPASEWTGPGVRTSLQQS